MKKTFFCLLVLVLIPLLLLTACGGNGDETTPAPSTPPAAFSDIAAYTIVYPTDADPEIFRAARAVRDAIKAATGESLPMREDFVGLGQEVPTDTKEILIGFTNRAESSSHLLRFHDTGIYFENSRLVITGGSPAAVAAAAEAYIASYVSGAQVLYPTTADIVRASYTVDSVTLDGVSLGEYVIVRDSANTALALYLQDEIAAATGYRLSILAPRDPARGTREIVLGNPDGDGRTLPSTPAKGSYVIAQSGSRLFLYGDGEDGAYSAALALLSMLRGQSGTLTLSFTAPQSSAVKSYALYSTNLPKTSVSAADRVGLEMTAENVMERFMLSKEALPDEITVLSCVSETAYPLTSRLQVFVSPSGNDKNAGTKDAPFATLTKAAEAVKGKGGGIIWMMEGTYSLSTTATFTALHSGTRHAPLFLKAYEGADVTLTSNTPLSTDASLWQYVDPAENAGIYERLPEEVRGDIMYTKLVDHGLTSDAFAKISTSGAPRLYVGEEEYTLARYPNDTGNIKDLLYFTYVYDAGSVTLSSSSLYWEWLDRAAKAGKDPATWIVGWEIRIPTEDAIGREILDWVNTGDIWCYGSTYSGYEHAYYNLALETEGQGWAHNADGTAWVMGSNETPYLGYPKSDGKYSLKSVNPNSRGSAPSGNSPAGRNTYYIFNAVEALDAPGEWFLDRESGILYVYPTEAMQTEKMAISGQASSDLLYLDSVQNMVVDGIKIDGANGIGIRIKTATNVVVQNVTVTHTKSSSVLIRDSRNVAVLYSDLSHSTGTGMIQVNNISLAEKLEDTGIVIQNNVFHDAEPTYDIGVYYSGYHTVISHNYFEDTTCHGHNAIEAVVEYNVFEGGSKDVTDGGMIYAAGYTSRGNHYRYNLIHMFHATHNAIYNDGMGSGHYAYDNTISFLGSTSNLNKGWYSSTGMGNVCFGNIMVLRNPYQVAAANSSAGAEDGNIVPANSGDQVNQSGLFYYYFGDEYSGAGTARRYSPVGYDGASQISGYLGQSEAGHWWFGTRLEEQAYYMGETKALWSDTDPAFINMLEGTRIVIAAYEDASCDYHPKYFYVPWYLSGMSYTYADFPADAVLTIPQYAYLDASGQRITVPSHEAERNDDGSITLTYEELAAVERFRRQPAACVISDNILLGGTPTYEGGKYTTTSDPSMIITDGVDSYQGYVPTALVENNFFEYLYDEILFDAEEYQYDLLPGALEAFEEVLSKDGYAMIESIDWRAAGLSFEYPYLSGTR
ncbi:MAG: right-handed parallel beta-helix repeat-containing protein [Clostridia bacterium]|nr:right-handed parallel beta-helix repeat-containing protein [Clostridia bacterium]